MRIKMIKNKIIITIITLSVIFAASCKKWEGKFSLYNLFCSSIYYTEPTSSSFGVNIDVLNQEYEGIRAEFVSFTISLYQDNTLIFQFDNTNYLNLGFKLSIIRQTGIPDSYTISPGTISITTGSPDSKWTVPGDIFNGNSPNRLVYQFAILDENGYTHEFSGEKSIEHLVQDNPSE